MTETRSLHSARTRRWVVQGLLLLLGLGLFLGAVVFLRQWLHDRLRLNERYRIPFADIECTPPPGLEKQVFFTEVQYLSELPEELWLLEKGLEDRLAKGFAMHPRVERVEEVEVAPPRVRVRMTYREPLPSKTKPER